MKKFLFAVAALATSLTASAQLWVGGSLDFDNSKEWQNDKSRTDWSISPKVGYALDDALEVGLGFGISGASFENNLETKSSQLTFSVAPFVRYSYFSEGNFSLFVEGNVSYYYYSGNQEPNVGETVKTSNWSFGVNILPGFKYTLTDHFALVGTFGRLSYNHYRPDKEDPAWIGAQNSFGFNLHSGYSIGLYYAF